MHKTPRVTGKQLLRFLEKQGFELRRVSGSHHLMRREQMQTVIPVHGNQNLKIGTLRGILRDIDLSPEDFEDLWNK